MMGPLRVMIFNDRPDTLLLIAPEGATEIVLSPIPLPVTKGGVAEALSLAGIDARVSESVPGRWTTAITQARNAGRAERGQQQRQREATEAAFLRGSAASGVRDRAEAIAMKLVVDEKIRVLKAEIGHIKSVAFTQGVFIPSSEFRAKERLLDQLKGDGQALQTKLGGLKTQEKKKNQALDGESLRRAVRELVSDEQWGLILDRKKEIEEVLFAEAEEAEVG